MTADNHWQVCVCPEYVLINRDIQDAFIEAIQEVYVHYSPAP